MKEIKFVRVGGVVFANVFNVENLISVNAPRLMYTLIKAMAKACAPFGLHYSEVSTRGRYQEGTTR